MQRNSNANQKTPAVRINPACASCGTSATLLVGLPALLKENPRSAVPGLIMLVPILGSAIIAWVAYDWIIAQYEGSRTGAFAKLLIMLCLLFAGRLVLVRLPFRGLVCEKCRGLLWWRFSTKVPLGLQESIRPDYRCTCCLYELRGLPTSVCPECGSSFPEAWLLAMKKGIEE